MSHAPDSNGWKPSGTVSTSSPPPPPHAATNAIAIAVLIARDRTTPAGTQEVISPWDMSQDKRITAASATTEEFLVAAMEIINKQKSLHDAGHASNRELVVALVD